MSNVSTRFTMAISNLKSKDDRKRRRAVRELFELDDEKHLSAFVPLLADPDIWYRSKAIDAFRMWSIRQEVSVLEPLITHQNIEFNRVAANLLEKFDNAETEVIRRLFDKDDLVCQIRSAEFILKCDGQELFFAELLKNPDARLRIIALESKYSSTEILADTLNDDSIKVVEFCLNVLNDNKYKLDDEIINSMVNRGVSNKLLIPYLFDNDPEKLVELAAHIGRQDVKILVDTLRKNCISVDDEPIKSMINSNQRVIVGRWLQGKKGPSEDALRWEIIGDETVDEIERARFLERLFSRCAEAEIKSKAKEIAETSNSELIKLTAHNLSTASEQAQS